MNSTSLRFMSIAAFGSALCLLVACGSDTTGGTGGTSSTSSTGSSSSTGGATPSKGLTLSAATVASLDGTYDIQVARSTGTGTGLAFNGNFNGQIEIEIDTDASGAVLAAHVWNYTGTTGNVMPDKFYGCDSKATSCAGVTVNTTTNVITLGGVTWPEVSMVSFDTTKPDTLATGGGKVTVSGILQAK
jgi:hypothetical protein